jgi:hypothetical protein
LIDSVLFNIAANVGMLSPEFHTISKPASSAFLAKAGFVVICPSATEIAIRILFPKLC